MEISIKFPQGMGGNYESGKDTGQEREHIEKGGRERREGGRGGRDAGENIQNTMYRYIKLSKKQN